MNTLWLLILLITACSGSSIHNNIASARKAARNSGKDILILFSNPVDCYACSKLKKEVLSTKKWKSFSRAQFETVVVHYSRKNSSLQQLQPFRIPSIPALFLSYPSGRVYTRTGYRKGGVDAYIRHIKMLQKQKKRISSLISSIHTAKPEEAISALKTLILIITRSRISGFYKGLLEKAHILDPDNRAGVRLSADTLLYRMGTDSNKQQHTILKRIRTIDPATAARLELAAKIRQIETRFMARYHWKEALSRLTALSKAERKPSADILYQQGRCLYQLAKYEKSAMCFKRALQIRQAGGWKRKLNAWLRSARYQLKKQKGQ